MLSAEGLRKSYGSKEAVRGVDLSVPAGMLYGFLGPNGAGKTTTIKMLTGLLRPSGGTVHVAGHDMLKEPVKAKARMALVPDQPRLFDKLSAREFLSFTAEIYGVEPEKARRRTGELFEMFELTEAADELVDGYSHGMRQKTALSAALLHEPDVLFLDEPTVGLDPASARLIKDILRGIVERGGTVFLTTHILEIAEALCDRVGIIKDGSLIAEGTIQDLRAGARGEDRETGEAFAEDAQDAPGESLEEIFLGLTGSGEGRQLAGYLRGEE
jgi:ABC-2 type transport system ATP-binding protein